MSKLPQSFASANWAYHNHDALGSLRQLTDAGGTVTLTQSYLPYGDELSSSGVGASSFGFTGEMQDIATGLVYLRARYYAPWDGRFLTQDPFAGISYSPLTHNGWSYVENNPANLVDPTGLFSNDTIARSLGASSFNDVFQEFQDNERWGLLRLLQKAKAEDNLTILEAVEFGLPEYVSHGKFQCVNGEIMVNNKSLRLALARINEADQDFLWREVIQGYYLNSQPFRDTYKTELPDFALLSAEGDIRLIGGLSGQVAYIVDRYGQPYWAWSLSGSVGVLPIGINYTEGYVSNRILSPTRLKKSIEGLNIGQLSGTFLFINGSFHVAKYYDVITMGLSIIPNFEVGVGIVSRTRTLPKSLSINPQGWDWMEDLPSYEGTDIPKNDEALLDYCQKCK